MVYPALLPLTRTPRLSVVDRTDAPPPPSADLNGLVRFAEWRNLVSVRVTSHFIRMLPSKYSKCHCTWLSSSSASLTWTVDTRCCLPTLCTAWTWVVFFNPKPLYLREVLPTSVVPHSVSEPLWDRDPVNSFFTRRGPGPNRFTLQYLFISFFKFIH